MYFALPSSLMHSTLVGARETHRHVRRAEDVAGHVADRAAAEIGERAPVVRRVRGAERAVLGAAEPGFPIEGRRHGRFLRDHVGALRPIGRGTIGPGVDFGDVADVAVPDNLRALAGAGLRVSLVAHLRRDAVLGGGQGELLRLPNGAGERLLTIDVLAALHRPHGGAAVHVVGTGDGDGVDVAALLVEHLAIVGVLGDFRVGGESLFGALGIGVGHGDDVLVGASGDIAVALAAGADRGDVQLLIRGFVPEMFEGGSAAEPCRGDGAGQQGAVEEMPSRNAFVFHLRTMLSTLRRARWTAPLYTFAMLAFRALPLALALTTLLAAQQTISLPTQDGGRICADLYGQGDRVRCARSRRQIQQGELAGSG